MNSRSYGEESVSSCAERKYGFHGGRENIENDDRKTVKHADGGADIDALYRILLGADEEGHDQR